MRYMYRRDADKQFARTSLTSNFHKFLFFSLSISRELENGTNLTRKMRPPGYKKSNDLCEVSKQPRTVLETYLLHNMFNVLVFGMSSVGFD